MDEKQTSLLGELERLELSIRTAQEELELLKLQLELGYREMDVNLRQVQALEASIRELKPHLMKRAVDLYKLGRLSYLRLLVSVENPAHLSRAYRLISRLARADAEKLARFRAGRAQLEQRKAELLDQTRKALQTRGEIARTAAALEARRSQKSAMLEEIERRREMAETLLGELETSREELAALIEKVAAGEEGAPPVHLPIRLFRGELDLPAEGRLASRFGRQRHPRFQTVTQQNGIEIEVPLGSPVHAVYDGKVVFASWFKGYGRLVILSHPHKVHSLYGHLDEVKVTEGETVSRGREIGRVGERGPLAGPGLYFEIREEGKPVDPMEWIRAASLDGAAARRQNKQ
jgi:septal ring factor EnvC (AmiA/AmiB activator)